MNWVKRLGYVGLTILNLFAVYIIGVIVFWCMMPNALDVALLWPVILFLAILIKIIGW